MACSFAEPHGPKFLPMRILDRGQTQESPTHDTDPEACYSGCTAVLSHYLLRRSCECFENCSRKCAVNKETNFVILPIKRK
jgi:hypothetical protein